MSNNVKADSSDVQVFNYSKQKSNYFNDFSDLPHLLLNWIERNSNDVVGIWGEKGNLYFISENTKVIYGYQSNELLGDKWRKTITSEELVYFYETLNRNIKHQSINVNIRHFSGRLTLSNAVIERVKDSNNNRVYYMAILQDISDKIEMQDIVNDSKATLLTGEVAASIAHEIRNPLTSLKGFLQLLQSGISEKEVYYQIMIDEMDKIEMITSDLLLVSKPLAREKKPESIYPILHDVIVLLNSQAHLKNIKVLLPEFQDVIINCAKSQIKQVLINIIKNAIEASVPSGRVFVKLAHVTSNIHLDIIDEGPGIPSDILQRLNEPFFTTKENGTGLGLMISNQILKQHSGKLEIITNEIKGSTFRIILPYIDA